MLSKVFFYSGFSLHVRVLSCILFRSGKKVSDDSYSGSYYFQQCSFFRNIAGIACVIGGTSMVVYLNPSVRVYFTEIVPQLKCCMDRIDHFYVECRKKLGLFNIPGAISFSIPGSR